MTGAHWIVLLTAPRAVFGGPRSDRAQRAYGLLEQVVSDYVQPALTTAAGSGATSGGVAGPVPEAATLGETDPLPGAGIPADAVPEVTTGGPVPDAAPDDRPVEPGPPVGGVSSPAAAHHPAEQDPGAPDPVAPTGTDAGAPATQATAAAAAAVNPVPVPATLHEARAALPKLIQAAGDGRPTLLARGTDHALLTAPGAAAVLGWDLTSAAAHGIADGRKKLGDLIQQAAQGRPQVLRRHAAPVAVLVPAAADGAPRPPGVPAAERGADISATTAPSAAGPAGDPSTGLLGTASHPQPGPSAAAPTSTPLPNNGVDSSPAPADAPPTTPTALTASTAPDSPDSADQPPDSADQPPHAASAAALTTAGPRTGVAAPADGLAPSPSPSATAEPGTTTTTAPPRALRRLAPFGQALDTILTTAPAAPDAEPPTALPRGLPTGIPSLDQALGGLQPGRFYLVAAGPGTGGSLIATGAAGTTTLDHHQTVLYAASGLTRADVAARIVAAHLPVDYRRLRAGQLNPTEQYDVTTLHHQLAAAPLYIDDLTGLTAAAIAESATGLPGVALVVVDRLQSADDPRLPLSGPGLVDAAQALAHLARTRHLPVLAVLDTTDPDLIAALGLDITLTLTLTPDTSRYPDPDLIRLTITERDLGTQATLTLHADRAHARITDPIDPYAGIRELTPEEAAAIKPFPAHAADLFTPATPHPAPEAPTPTDPTPAPEAPTTTPAAAPHPAPAPSVWPPVAVPGHTVPEPDAAPAAVPGGPARPAPARRELATGPAPASAAQAPAAALAAISVTDADPVAGSVAAPRRGARPSGTRSSGGYAGRDYSYFTGQIARTVEQALEEHGGDVEAATEALVKKAVPNAMALFEETRVGGNYDYTVYPEILEFLKKKTTDGVDEVWEGRHNWTNTVLVDQLNAGALPPATVDVLDTNAAFLSAFKAHLPIGALKHDPTGGFDPKRSGIYLLGQRPSWEHPNLPDPIGNRRETGPVLLDDATIRLMIRCSRNGLCEAPVIAECWTSGASEGLLEKFRRVLTESRTAALERETAGYADGTVTIEYGKSMYSKFTSTLGESNANLDIRRPEWMHIIRSQAFANLWYKAHKAHQSGLVLVRLRGTDEIHVTGGQWRSIPGREGGVFEEGRQLTQMKLKDQYTLPRTAA